MLIKLTFDLNNIECVDPNALNAESYDGGEIDYLIVSTLCDGTLAVVVPDAKTFHDGREIANFVTDIESTDEIIDFLSQV